MKRLYIIFLFLNTYFLASSQRADTSFSSGSLTPQMVASSCGEAFMHLDTVYGQVDRMPQYPGGDTALTRHLLSNMKLWTKSAQPFYIEFTVEKDGSVQRLSQPAPKYLPPEWELAGLVGRLHLIPGTLNGQPVRVRVRVPVYIRHRQ